MSLLKHEKLPMELIKRLADGCDPAYGENGKDPSYDYEELITSMAQHVLELSAKLEIVNTLMDAATELNNLAKENTEKLVAENAAINDRLQKLIHIVNNADNSYCMCGDLMKNHATGGCGSPTGMFDYHYNAWLESEKETPTIAAAIAEIKAQGLMELAESCDGYAENHVYTFTKVHAEEFAAKLRAGRKG